MNMFEIYDGRPALYQWDLNRHLIVNDKECSQVHFYNGTTEKVPACEVYDLDGNRVVDVPNLLLQTNRNITVYAYIKAQDGAYTKRAELFQVLSRPKPDDYVYTETEVKSWDALAERVAYLEGEGLAAAVADYLEENPIEAGATAGEAAQIQKNKEDIESLQEDKLDASRLPEAVNGALAQAKASGAFDGAPGEPGADYILTEADKQEIARQAAGLVEVPDDYVLPIGGENLGGVKNGGNVVINADGTMDAPIGGSNQPLTFTGAVSATYDGSQAVEVEIPQGGGGGGELKKVADETLAADVASWAVTLDKAYKKFKILICAFPSANVSAGSAWLEINIGEGRRYLGKPRYQNYFAAECDVELVGGYLISTCKTTATYNGSGAVADVGWKLATNTNVAETKNITLYGDAYLKTGARIVVFAEV